MRQCASAWLLGIFTTGDGRKLRIVDMFPAPEPETEGLGLAGVWLVEPAE